MSWLGDEYAEFVTQEPLRETPPWPPFSCVGETITYQSQKIEFVRSDFNVDEDVPEAYEPALWSEEALVEGALKGLHDSAVLYDDEAEIMYRWLVRMFGAWLMTTKPVAPQQALARLNLQASSGVGFESIGPTKGDVVMKLGPNLHSSLWQFFETQTCVCGTVLKSELRLKGKKPRLFTPVNIAMVYVGNCLYQAMDDALLDNTGKHPICIGMEMPGAGINAVYDELDKFSPYIVAFDAQRWDMCVPLCLALIVGRFRENFLPTRLHAAHRRYYWMVYFGFIKLLGRIIQMNNQKSGQTLTASDNSYMQCLMMFLHAIRNGLTFEQFCSGVKFFCMGDDLIISDRTGKFTAAAVAATYRSMGLYLECHTTVYHDILEASFCGTTPVRREIRGKSYLLPLFRVDKLLDSLRWRKKNTSVADFVQKLVSILILVYPE